MLCPFCEDRNINLYLEQGVVFLKEEASRDITYLLHLDTLWQSLFTATSRDAVT